MTAHISPQHFTAARQINSQINKMERESNLPVVNSRPLRLGLDISDACNVNCIFCIAAAGRKGKNDPQAFRKPDYLDQFMPIVPFVEKVIFSSYEAVLNPWLDQFVEKPQSVNSNSAYNISTALNCLLYS